MTDARLFALQRDHDVTGVSGTGIVADGVRWPDGTVSIRWRGERPSTVSWNSLDDAEHVHGHGGATRIVWSDLDGAAIPPGGNAEDCPRCTDPNPPYPFLCPGHPAKAQQDTVRTVPDTTALRHLVDRAARGVASTDEGQQLRDGVEHLLLRLDQTAARVVTLEHVAAGNKRHVQLIAPDIERAEAAIGRVRAECDVIEAERARVGESFGDGMVDATARIRCALDGPAVEPCEQHPGAPVIGGMCGGCTVYPADMR